MKILYNKNEVISAARYILANKPSSHIASEIPRTDRGYLPERGEVDDILRNIRTLAKLNKEVFVAIQQKHAAGDANYAHLWQKWIEVLGVGGYWIIAQIEGDTMNISIAVTTWFGETQNIEEEI